MEDISIPQLNEKNKENARSRLTNCIEYRLGHQTAGLRAFVFLSFIVFSCNTPHGLVRKRGGSNMIPNISIRQHARYQGIS
jgi:hypothetical protein